ncbi:hypothetical protein TI39_contig4487g00001 [Zymoseptoria brevis]|uniref:Uncharacterized protein n=1 Tax=Zymoseptoria brevis TaxID=1047168 RepID=A0A0F4G6M5_9PEZI|nr:hypothetical protein TI39_contig4487g00001 [Zymoseptoria brevis]
MQRSIEHELQTRVEALEAEVKDLRIMITHILQLIPEPMSPTSTLRADNMSPTSTLRADDTSPTSILRAGAVSPTSTLRPDGAAPSDTSSPTAIKQEPTVETPRKATISVQSMCMINANGMSSSPVRRN